MKLFNYMKKDPLTISGKPRSIGWNVYRNGKRIDTVFYTSDCDKEYVLKSLIDHDGYPFDISIRKSL